MGIIENIFSGANSDDSLERKFEEECGKIESLTIGRRGYYGAVPGIYYHELVEKLTRMVFLKICLMN